MLSFNITTNINKEDLNILKLFKPKTYKKENNSYCLSFHSDEFFPLEIKNDKLFLNNKIFNENITVAVDIEVPEIYLKNIYLNSYITLNVYDFFYKIWRFEIKNPPKDLLEKLNINIENLNLLEFYIRFDRLECITTKTVYEQDDYNILN